ncbi:glycoside hydrolase superfamily [Immersiella caudata]|uniref:cellulase n=1 Tax=Immersiella caudata TaxID=314043 RepID=A0AA39TKT4_9PEZI|nr:glycoside hydrolase superfamily [Immersiella caudata]
MLVNVITSFAFAGLTAARVQFIGASITGGDPQCTAGACPPTSGEAQMEHFAKDNMMNLFRLPISSQSFASDSQSYDRLVQSCIATGASCLLSITSALSNTTNTSSASLWTQLATKYSSTPSILFELSSDSSTILQTLITTIRTTGATNPILLPATNSPPNLTPLLSLTNPDGTTSNLHLALHAFLDADCTTNNTATLTEVASVLRTAGRKAVITETGAAPGNPLCLVRFCEQNKFVNDNPDVFMGLVSWGAGGAETEPEALLSQTPLWEGGRLVDQPLMAQCVVGTWIGSTVGVSKLLQIGEPEKTGVTVDAPRSGSARLSVPCWVVASVLYFGISGLL